MNSEDHLRKINLTQGSYLECMTRAFLGGLSTFTIVFTGAFFGQRVILSKISVVNSKKKPLIGATAAASLLSYYVASRQIRDCQKSFNALNE